jgi:hypothetical protein
MTAVKPLPTPMDAQWKYGNEPAVSDPDKHKMFRSRVGSLSYYSQCTRPDISFAVNCLCRHLHDPNPACFRALNHLIHYIAGTPHLGIKYQIGDSSTLRLEEYFPTSPTGKDPSLSAYSDASWGGEDCDSAKSQSGYIVYFGGGPIDWKSHLQPVIAQSSTESEQVAAHETARSVFYFRQLLEEFGKTQTGTTVIWEDNQGCIAQSKNPVNSSRSKHILLKYHYLRDLTESGIVRLQYIPTTDQIADIFTKPLPPKQFINLSRFLVHPS